jgi:hypothetical protein
LTNASEAVHNTFEWFERNSGWAPPDPGSIEEWLADGLCRCPDECIVEPGMPCPHGLASWWLVLRCVDRADRRPPVPPEMMVPHPRRLDPGRADFVAIIDAHHGALCAGRPGYADPATGLFVLTAGSLWDNGSCCQKGCRHCPFVRREPA